MVLRNASVPFWFQDCWLEFVDGLMWLVGIEAIFFTLGRMSFSSFCARLMILGSELKGTTIYGANERDLSRWARNSLTRCVWLFFTVSHCAQFAHLLGIENLEQKIMRFNNPVYFGNRCHILERTLLTMLRSSPSAKHHRHDMNQIVRIRLCISWSVP